MKRKCIFATLFTLFFGGCVNVERFPVRTEETAIIACEAGHVTIQTVPPGQVEESETNSR